MKLQPDPFLPRDLPGLVRQLTTLWRGLVAALGNVDNTSDSDKPVSTAQAAADAAVQAYSIIRGHHTGTQTMATISDLPTLAYGTYTPTLTNSTNIAASTAYPCQWLRVGDTVTVSGKVDIDPTAAAVTQLAISLPVASDLAAVTDCCGVGSSRTESAQIEASPTLNTAFFDFSPVSLVNTSWFFTFTYRVI